MGEQEACGHQENDAQALDQEPRGRAFAHGRDVRPHGKRSDKRTNERAEHAAILKKIPKLRELRQIGDFAACPPCEPGYNENAEHIPAGERRDHCPRRASYRIGHGAGDCDCEECGKLIAKARNEEERDRDCIGEPDARQGCIKARDFQAQNPCKNIDNAKTERGAPCPPICPWAE